MKPVFLFSLLLALLLPLTAANAAVYRCPMHPWIKSDKPGDKCTICGMDLVAASDRDHAADADPNIVTLQPAGANVIGVQVSTIGRGPLVRTLRVAGIVDDDDTRHRIISARVPGRVEKLFINYVGAEVREGEPLATVYSPEMLTAQRQYVERLRAGTAFTEAERAGARERLLELGLTREDVDILEHTLEPTAMVTVRAPISGTVVARHVYEGQELNRDSSDRATQLFEVADFSSMWFVFDAYEPDLAWLRVGQSVSVRVLSQPGRVFTAPIAFIDPNLNEMTRTAKVRVVMPNFDHSLLHKQTGYATVRLEIPDVLLAPRRAVLQHGGEPVVFLQLRDRAYVARRVRLGRVGDDNVEILAGVAPGDHVVTEGGLLLDGQAQLARASITGDIAPLAAPVPIEITAAADYDQLKELALATADAGSALAADDLAGYRKGLPRLQAALEAALQLTDSSLPAALDRYRRALHGDADLRQSRREFEPFSTAVADLARESQVLRREGLHLFQCPMSPVLGTARWLSHGREPKNPFFGSAMPHCGEEVN